MLRTAQMSIAAEYGSLRITSGARYQRVTTYLHGAKGVAATRGWGRCTCAAAGARGHLRHERRRRRLALRLRSVYAQGIEFALHLPTTPRGENPS